MAVAEVGVRNRFEPHQRSPLASEDATADASVNGLPVVQKDVILRQPQQQQQLTQRLKAKAEELESRFLQQLTTQFKEFMHDFVSNTEQALDITGTDSNGKALVDSAMRPRSGELPQKIFVPRNSVLTELFEINHIRTVYNIFAAILIIFSIQTLVYDVLEQGRVVLDFDLLFFAFGKLPMALFIWLLMAFGAAAVHPAFHLWAHNRASSRAFDSMALTAYMALQSTLLILPVKHIMEHELAPVSAIIVAAEQVRLMMKVHAFVRVNVPLIINHQFKNGRLPCPDFSQYLYFLFAPTLVYRDKYPRTTAVNWRFVASNIFQVVVCIFYTYYIFERFCVPVFRNFNREHLSPKAFLLATFGCMLPGTLALLIAFFAVLHSWLNAFAEMLRFADRLFYKDWWNSTSFSNYYRTWNIVVHDWLYAYVYQDLVIVFGKRNRWLAMLVTFLLSAAFHEYILVLAFGFFYPVLFVMFGGVGCVFNFVTDPRESMRGARTYNILLWLMLFVGTGLLMCLYSMEWYARQNCPVVHATEYSFSDYLIPRSWFCQ